MLTPERKQQINSIVPMYRGLYWGQYVLFSESFNEMLDPEEQGLIAIGPVTISHDGYLSLRSVKDLTEEEYRHIGRLFSNYRAGDLVDAGRSIVLNVVNLKASTGLTFEFALILIDYLRSRSIALPYMGITVEEFIEAGTIVIR